MMDRDVGDRSFPVWLIGDSNPVQWQSHLKTPLDPRHPIRHNIWTSIIDVVQDRVFRANGSRIDTSLLYIRNAVDDPAKKPASANSEWTQTTECEIDALRHLLTENKPTILLCFGAFAFEFTRRALCEQEQRAFNYWGARSLGEEFRRRIEEFDPGAINLIPLLHRSVSGGKFIESHEYFCNQTGANYFQTVADSLADKLILYRDQLHIWIT